MNHRLATVEDVPLLADMNRQLTEDEGHRNRFQDVGWFEARMRSFLEGPYQAVLFERAGQTVAYALFCADGADTVHLRQIFVGRQCRRQKIGQTALAVLRQHYWPRERRITVGVLVGNAAAMGFYKAAGFCDYSVELELRPV